MSNEELQDALDYVWRTEQSGARDPATDRRYLVMLAGEVVRLQAQSKTANAAIDRILDIAAAV